MRIGIWLVISDKFERLSNLSKLWLAIRVSFLWYYSLDNMRLTLCFLHYLWIPVAKNTEVDHQHWKYIEFSVSESYGRAVFGWKIQSLVWGAELNIDTQRPPPSKFKGRWGLQKLAKTKSVCEIFNKIFTFQKTIALYQSY